MYKDVYDIIGSYSNNPNLNDFMEGKNILNYTCDYCSKIFLTINKNNIMIYEMVHYNNDSIYKFKDAYGKLSLMEYMNLTNIKVKKSRYHEILKIYCSDCCKKHNKLEYFDKTNEPLHISKSHLYFIKLSENLFVKDYISKKILLISRYRYKTNEETGELTIKSLSINKKQSLKMIITNPKFKKILDMLQDDFSFDTEDEDIEKLLY